VVGSCYRAQLKQRGACEQLFPSLYGRSNLCYLPQTPVVRSFLRKIQTSKKELANAGLFDSHSSRNLLMKYFNLEPIDQIHNMTHAHLSRPIQSANRSRSLSGLTRKSGQLIYTPKTRNIFSDGMRMSACDSPSRIRPLPAIARCPEFLGQVYGHTGDDKRHHFSFGESLEGTMGVHKFISQLIITLKLLVKLVFCCVRHNVRYPCVQQVPSVLPHIHH
jgi:hypothetical protein